MGMYKLIGGPKSGECISTDHPFFEILEKGPDLAGPLTREDPPAFPEWPKRRTYSKREFVFRGRINACSITFFVYEDLNTELETFKELLRGYTSPTKTENVKKELAKAKEELEKSRIECFKWRTKAARYEAEIRRRFSND